MSKLLSCVSAGKYPKDSTKETVGGVFDEYNCCGENSKDSSKESIVGFIDEQICCGVSGTTNSLVSANSSDLERLLNKPTLLIVILPCGVRRAPLNLICERFLVHMGGDMIF